MIWIYGKHPTFAVLLNNRRKAYKIVVTKNTKPALDQFLSKNKIKINPSLIRVADNGFISSLVSDSAVHQGFAVQASDLPTTTDKELILKLNKLGKDDLPPILILDQLTDPHNIGAIIRSAAAFGVKNIVITKHNFPKDGAIICKSSVGTIESVNMVVAGNLNNLLADLKNIGYWCLGLDGSARTNINQAKDYDNVALVVGSEGEGMRNLVKKNCDLLVKIPMSAEVESLNVSNAVAISLYELFG
ncbi:MAG: 23S rRNA (guanosine(2251)-2'-O)-methyltransferase RlmB [Proteobacteria bacterium]|nr:23S rRNA (guanosine(2251)-2'-O)-methyltransferase RlmB [Pseudomonadota bacterium]